ncbi:IDEAL domain-containing protein [Neobacillus niacini]|uniref:IDEAL domain-containing protein n=1 Tax=Neobacillus niacini TaxID=86668 RepID=UPI002860B454|nr:IDEAL domain-containing protein [Neobacillus niacini]MDR7002361.1 uncharacterized protein YpiB (UPF0302 family) [Neobacillus niacini]
MEKKLLNSPQQPNEDMDSKMAEMVLNNALLEFRKAKIREEIDHSLMERNKEKFLKLTEELKKIS